MQRWVLEDFNKSLPVAELVVGLEGFCHRCYDFLLDGACGLERNQQRQVVVRCVSFVHHLEVEGLCHNHTAVILARVECIVEDGCRKGAEDVAATEVYPCGFFGGLLAHCFDVELRKLIAFGFPFSSVEVAGKDIVEFHFNRRIRVVCILCLILCPPWRGCPALVPWRTYARGACSRHCGRGCSRP